MREVKVIPAVSGAGAYELGIQFSDAGADELYYVKESEADTEMIAKLAGAVDIPVVVRTAPKQISDIEAVFSSGGSRVIVETEDEALLDKAVLTYGTERIGVVINTYYVDDVVEAAIRYSQKGVGVIYITDHTTTGENMDLLNALRSSVANPIMINAGDVHDDFVFLANYVAATGVDQCIVSLSDVSKLNALKTVFADKGIGATGFRSRIPFSEFKLNGDGLIPVVVQNYESMEVLMVAYMNEESYNMTVRTGRMTYYSRSRNTLWVKGETSGHFQYVKSLQLDCDRDTILAKVAQIGAACHTGNPTCFFTDLV